MLDQAEFTSLCLERQFPVLIDVGHAHANGWDLPLLIHDLWKLIGGFHLHNNDGVHDLHNRLREGTLDFAPLVRCMDCEAPDAPRVIEYSRPEYNGNPLQDDIAYLRELSGSRQL